jgi:hypothetical protein
MVLRTARGGPYAGQLFWGCSTFPKCWARIGVKGQVASSDDAERDNNEAGASAQARFEFERNRQIQRARDRWPLLVGLVVIAMVLAFIIGSSLGQPALGATAAAGVAIVFMLVYFERSRDVDAWFRGAEGEKRTGRYLAELEAAGFVVHNDRRGPGYGGNIDHIAIGPTGVWVIETKSYRGEVAILGDRLEINDRPSDKIVDQVYRESVAVQIALGDRLTSRGITVAPVLCLHRAKLGWSDKSVRGVRIVDGRGLVTLLGDARPTLGDSDIQSLAADLDRLFPPARRA